MVRNILFSFLLLFTGVCGLSAATNDSLVKQDTTAVKFKGGDDAFYEFLSQNLNYPSDAKKSGASGVFYIAFIVFADGHIDSVTCTTDFKPSQQSLVNEAVRVMKLTDGKWIPSMVAGKPRSTHCKVPIEFSLL